MAESSESEGQANGDTSSQEEPVDGMWIGISPEEEHEFTSSVNVRKETCSGHFSVLGVIDHC